MEINLGDLASTVFFVMQFIFIHVGTKRRAVWAGHLRKLSFLCKIAQTEEYIASVDYCYQQYWLDIHMKSCGFSLLQNVEH